MANLGRNLLGDSQKCVHLSTPCSEVTKIFLFAQFPLYFPVILEDHPILFTESGNANISGEFSSPDVYFAEKYLSFHIKKLLMHRKCNDLLIAQLITDIFSY